MRSSLLPSSLRTRKVSFQHTGDPHLDVIHEVEERGGDSNGFEQTVLQDVYSSSPTLSSFIDFCNSDLPLSQSSATSVSDILRDEVLKDSSSSTIEAQFAQDLHGRLAKLSGGSETVYTSSIPPSSRTQSSTTSSTLSMHRTDSIIQFRYKRTKSDSFSLTFRSMKPLSVENQSTPSPLTRKRPRPPASFHVHSPYLIANSANHKKRRLLRHATIADPNRYATRTASFRRALSLRSQAPDIQEKAHLTVIPTPASLNAGTSSLCSTLDLEPSPGWIPTVPCSPEPEQPAHTTPLRRAQNYRDPLFDPDVISPIAKDAQKAYDVSKKQARILSSKVPIIAPPPNHVYSPPLSEASQAKLRLIRFREREQMMRDTDFDMMHKTADVLAPSTPSTLAAEMRSVVVNEGHSEDVEMHLEELDDETDQLQAEDSKVSRRTSYKRCAGIHGSGTRMIQWILEALPSTSSSGSENNSNSSSSSCSGTSSSSSSHSLDPSNAASHSERLSDLCEQLLNSPETRFHAAYLFMRFFHLIFEAAYESDSEENEHVGETALEEFARRFALDVDGSELVTWDVAVGCLALSVKIHRDFLPPLYPIFSSDYEELAPHEMGYGDLEAAQRDILLALSYNLGSTPQAVLDDLWIALPSLRELLDFNEGWSSVLQETWLILFEVVCEPDIMNFSLSLLTAAAVIEGLESALIRQYQTRDPWYELFRCRRLSAVKKQKAEGEGSYLEFIRSRVPLRRSSPSSSSSSSSHDTKATHNMPYVNRGGDEFALRKAKERVRKAKIESEGVMLDIQAALGIADEQLKACRKWIAPFVGDRW
ncbi:hypothetical protein HHX47_DHR9000217 [Lentinula edodes]|nr:hypothetical protein HHX47_DHR9000217 [Lentinula edodes]